MCLVVVIVAKQSKANDRRVESPIKLAFVGSKVSKERKKKKRYLIGSFDVVIRLHKTNFSANLIIIIILVVAHILIAPLLCWAHTQMPFSQFIVILAFLVAYANNNLSLLCACKHLLTICYNNNNNNTCPLRICQSPLCCAPAQPARSNLCRNSQLLLLV